MAFNPGTSGQVPTSAAGMSFEEFLQTLSSNIPGSTIGSILGQFESASAGKSTAKEIGRLQDDKNAQIEALFQEALSGLDRFRDIANRRFNAQGELVKQRGIDVLESNRNFGREERRRVGESLTQANAADESSLVSRGLASTTVGSSLRTRNREIARRANLDITDRTATREAGLRLETGRDLERFNLARTEFQRSLLSERNRLLESRTVAFDPSAAIAALQAGGQQTSKKSDILGIVGSLAGTGIGAAVGGPGGAAAGGSIGGTLGRLAGR